VRQCARCAIVREFVGEAKRTGRDLCFDARQELTGAP